MHVPPSPPSVSVCTKLKGSSHSATLAPADEALILGEALIYGNSALVNNWRSEVEEEEGGRLGVASDDATMHITGTPYTTSKRIW